MKKTVLFVIIVAIVATAFVLFCELLFALANAMVPVWGIGIQNVVLVVPAAFVAVCYEMGVIMVARRFYPEIDAPAFK